MACNCDILVSYVLAPSGTTGANPIYINSVSLTAGIEINGHSSYTTEDYFYGLLTWQYQDSFWVVIDEENNVVAYLPNSSELECPGNSGEYGGTTWEVNTEVMIFSEMILYVCTPTPVCSEWRSLGSEVADFLIPYNLYLIYGMDISQLYVGQLVTSFTYNNPLDISGTGQYYIASILYLYNDQVFTTYTPGAEAFSIILQDSNGVIMQPGQNNGGVICFQPENYTTTNEDNQACFDKLVWEKQCEFSKQVLSYLNKMQYGDFTCCDDLDNLKNQRRVLEILNCYDTRDIAYNTTDYNTLTYSQIKKLLNS